jgi:hypothetical protein
MIRCRTCIPSRQLFCPIRGLYLAGKNYFIEISIESSPPVLAQLMQAKFLETLAVGVSDLGGHQLPSANQLLTYEKEFAPIKNRPLSKSGLSRHYGDLLFE